MGSYKNMKLSECPELYKIYVVKVTNGDKFVINGEQKKSIFESKNNLVELGDKGFNKSHIVSWSVDMEATRENVQAHAEEIKNALVIK